VVLFAERHKAIAPVLRGILSRAPKGINTCDVEHSGFAKMMLTMMLTHPVGQAAVCVGACHGGSN
jgi:hypothetical protein